MLQAASWRPLTAAAWSRARGRAGRAPTTSSSITCRRSSPTRTWSPPSSPSAPSSPPRSSSTSRPTCPSALVSHHVNTVTKVNLAYSTRVCFLHNQRGGTRGHPGHERLPGWHQEAQGPTEETQRRWKTLLEDQDKLGQFHWTRCKQPLPSLHSTVSERVNVAECSHKSFFGLW